MLCNQPRAHGHQKAQGWVNNISLVKRTEQAYLEARESTAVYQRTQPNLPSDIHFTLLETHQSLNELQRLSLDFRAARVPIQEQLYSSACIPCTIYLPDRNRFCGCLLTPEVAAIRNLPSRFCGVKLKSAWEKWWLVFRTVTASADFSQQLEKNVSHQTDPEIHLWLLLCLSLICAFRDNALVIIQPVFMR